ncbi:signal transduction histidine kinase/CheY-like chemotaxis protein [Clostridiales Family XIII bacterium PM5-7]
MLTSEELAYVKAHSTSDHPVNIGSEFDNFPKCFYNENEQEWQGISQDILTEITNLSGLQFRTVNEPNTPFSVLIEMLENHEISLIADLTQTADREDVFLLPDQPYATDYFTLISSIGMKDIDYNEVPNFTVALEEDTVFETVFLKCFPNHQKMKIYPDREACIDALVNGEVDLFMGSGNILLDITSYHEMADYKSNLIFDKPFYSTFGLNSDEKILRSIISKAETLIDITHIHNKWTVRIFDYEAKMLKARKPYYFIIGGMLLLTLVLLGYMFFKKQQESVRLDKLVQQRTTELELKTEIANVASNAKSKFLARMSHEIRTPLNAIIGTAQVIKLMPDQSEKTIAKSDEILDASNHLLSIINNILDVSKIETETVVLKNNAFSMHKTLHELTDMVEFQCEEKGIAFSTNADSISELYLVGDKARLKNALINLLDNAVKFTPPSTGEISFTVNVSPLENQEVSMEFIITDNGIGIDEQLIKKIFIPFSHDDEKISIQYGGVGLGLAASQNIVRHMGGEITVESQLGKGSTFSFTIKLPVAENPNFAEPTRGDAPVDDAALAGKRILLVEDVDINRLIVTELLSGFGLEIEEATNGREGLELVASSPEGYYDLVFMDIRMPEMDGHEATIAIRNLDRSDVKDLPILALSANAYSEDIQKSIQSGMNGHVAKPVELDSLKKAMLRHFKK